jgi:hypothetical protein
MYTRCVTVTKLVPSKEERGDNRRRRQTPGLLFGNGGAGAGGGPITRPNVTNFNRQK